MGRRARHFYVVGAYAFLPISRGVWVRTHYCTAVVDCPYPRCGAKVGEPCRNNETETEWCGTHYMRRTAAKHVRPAPGEFEYPPTLKIE